jgi:outer membrane protein TolC
MKSTKIITALLLFSYIPLFGQTYSLRQCVDYATKNNSNIKIANLDSDQSNQVVKEQVASGLPQVNFTGTITDNLKVTTSLLPGILAGKPGTFIPVQMGVKYNTAGTLAVTQKLYDPSFWVGLKAAKISETMSQQSLQKTSEQTMYDVSAAYYKATIIKKQLENLKLILETSAQTLKSTELRFSNGLAKKIDVDKIRVSYNSTNTNVQQTELSYKQALNNLKFAMGMQVDNAIELPSELPDSTSYTMRTDDNINPVENRIDYQIRKTNIELYEADKQNNLAAYQPTLSMFYNFGVQAMRNEFNFFDSQHWFNSSAVGVELKIPIFSGFKRLSKVEQSKISIAKAEENLKLTEQSIKVELSNYYIQYRNAIDNIQTEKENLALAEDVYKNTQMEFTHGAGSSLDVMQTESSLRETQNNYYSKLLTLYIAKLDLEKSRGTISNFINNLK